MRLRSLLIPLLTLAASLPAAEPPNIILILADDLGYGDVASGNPQSRIPTPALDRMAREGLRFTDAHAPDAVCTPSRYAMLTGRYCFRSRLESGTLRPWDRPLIEAGRLTLPGFLREAGYATACIGKWHLGWDWPTRDGKPPAGTEGLGNVDFTQPIGGGPLTRGFDTYFGVDLPNFPPYAFISGDRTVGLPTEVAPLKEGGINRPGPMVPGWDLTAIMPEITRRAVDYIEAAAAARSPQPFFLYFSLTAPHYPIVPIAEYHDRSGAGEYGDFVAQVDGTVGAVLAALDRTGLGTNTLVIFTSDNGPEVGEVNPGAYERMQLYGHSSAGDLRGAKRDIWEGGHRVPLLVRWPRRIGAGRVSDEPVSGVDLFATCAAVLGRSLPAGAAEDSYDLLPLLAGDDHPRPARGPIVLHGGDGKFGLRWGDWVYIDAPTGNGNRRARGAEPEWFRAARGYANDDQPALLYHLRTDLAQRTNVYAAHPEIVAAMKTLLARYRASGRSAP